MKTSVVLGLSLIILWGGASRGMPNLEGLNDDALNHVLEKMSDADLLPLRLVSKRVGAAATAELIRRGSLATFSMKTMKATDLPHLVSFLKARKTARTLTISDFQAGLFCQALMALRAEEHDFSFRSLRSLVVKNGDIPVEDLNRLLALLDMMPNLTHLTLGGNDIRDAGAQAIAGSPHLLHLTSLDLQLNNIGAAGARAIAESPHLAGLTSLNLGANNIRDAGAQAIAESPHLVTLTSLALRFNFIDATGARAIAGSPHLVNLTSLNLGYNRIGAAGAQAIVGSPHLVHLTYLNLEGNNLEAAGAEAIAASANMKYLAHLDLRGNNITAAGVQAIAGSPHLVHLGRLRQEYIWG